jgi:hypothetical protein
MISTLAPAIAILAKDLTLLPARVRRCRADCAPGTAMHDGVAVISSPARGFPSLTGKFLKLSHRSAPLMQRGLALTGRCGPLFAAS